MNIYTIEYSCLRTKTCGGAPIEYSLDIAPNRAKNLASVPTSRDSISATRRSQKKSKVSRSISIKNPIDCAPQNLYIRRLDSYIGYI